MYDFTTFLFTNQLLLFLGIDFLYMLAPILALAQCWNWDPVLELMRTSPYCHRATMGRPVIELGTSTSLHHCPQGHPWDSRVIIIKDRQARKNFRKVDTYHFSSVHLAKNFHMAKLPVLLNNISSFYWGWAVLLSPYLIEQLTGLIDY